MFNRIISIVGIITGLVSTFRESMKRNRSLEWRSKDSNVSYVVGSAAAFYLIYNHTTFLEREENDHNEKGE
jgi:hypothetical protein